MKQNNALFLTLYRGLISQFHRLSLDQVSILLWSMIKTKQNDKSAVLAIYKKIHVILQSSPKMELLAPGQQFPQEPELNSGLSQDLDNGKLETRTHYLHQSNFVHLIWSLQRTKIIDAKIILQLMKCTLQDKQYKNLGRIRIQNLSLLAYCVTELQLQKYRVSQTIIQKIMERWEEIQKLSILSLVLLSNSLSKFVLYMEQYLEKYKNHLDIEDIIKKQKFTQKLRNFVFLTVQAILLRQDQTKSSKGKKIRYNSKEQTLNQLHRLDNPLSGKFASQVILNLARLNLFQKNIWFKLLTSITDDIDQAEIQDLSMTLTALCIINTKELKVEDAKQIIFQHKKIVCKRIFQIYTSISGKSLTNVKDLIFQRKIQNQMVPSWIRKQVQKEYMQQKMQQKGQQTPKRGKDKEKTQENEQKAKDNQNEDQQLESNLDKKNKIKRNNTDSQANTKFQRDSNRQSQDHK